MSNSVMDLLLYPVPHFRCFIPRGTPCQDGKIEQDLIAAWHVSFGFNGTDTDRGGDIGIRRKKEAVATCFPSTHSPRGRTES